MWARGWRFLFGRDDVPGRGDRAATLPAGLLRGLGAEYRAWYRRDFHPDQIDDRERIVQARAAVGA